jgi:hypothetical protein
LTGDLCPDSFISLGGIKNTRHSRAISQGGRGHPFLLLAVLLVGDVLFLTKPSENWLEAAKMLRNLDANGVCFL